MIRAARLRTSLLCAALLVGAAAPAAGYPLLPMRLGGTPFEGPADPEATALWWNPAALGPMHGVRITLLGNGRFSSAGYDRASICPLDDGLPGSRCASGSPRAFGSESLTRDSFHGFGALTVNFNENITLALGVFAPWTSCPVGAICRTSPRDATLTGGTAGAYHLESESFTNVYFSLATSFRISSKINVGVSVSLIDSFADYSFYRDTALDPGPQQARCNGAPCGYENPLAAQRIRVRGDGGSFFGGIPLPTGIAANFGLLLRPTARLSLGFSWQRVFPAFSSSGSFGVSDPVGASVTPPANATTVCSDGSDGRTCSGGDAIRYSLPDVWNFGALIKLTRDLWLSTWGRVVTYGGYSTPDQTQRGIVIRLSGDAVQRGGAPHLIAIDHGLRTTFSFEGGLRWQPLAKLRLGASLIAEGWGAFDRTLVSPSAMDAPKLDLMVGAEWQLLRWLRLVASYGLTYFIPLDSSPSGYDPNATVSCAQANYAVQSCGAALDGRGLPTAAGTYTMTSHLVTAGALFEFF